MRPACAAPARLVRRRPPVAPAAAAVADARPRPASPTSARAPGPGRPRRHRPTRPGSATSPRSRSTPTVGCGPRPRATPTTAPTRSTSSRRPAPTPVKVIADLHTPLGLVWDGGTLYVASAGRVDAYRGFDGTAFATPPHGPDPAGRRRRGQRPRRCHRTAGSCSASRRRATRARRPPRTPRPSSRSSPTAPTCGSRRAGSARRSGSPTYPGTDDLFVTMNQRDDLGDATPGDWLSVVRSGQAWGFPDCYGQGGSGLRRRPDSRSPTLDAHAAVSGVAIVTGELRVVDPARRRSSPSGRRASSSGSRSTARR